MKANLEDLNGFLKEKKSKTGGRMESMNSSGWLKESKNPCAAARDWTQVPGVGGMSTTTTSQLPTKLQTTFGEMDKWSNFAILRMMELTDIYDLQSCEVSGI